MSSGSLEPARSARDPVGDAREALQENFRAMNTSGDTPGGGLEARVARIEATLEHVAMRDQAERINGRIDVLAERISHLPGKGFIVSGILALAALIGAFTVFQGAIQTVLGVAPGP